MLSIILYNDSIQISHYYETFIYPKLKSRNKIIIEIIENIIMYYYKIIDFEILKNIYNNLSNNLIKKIIYLFNINNSINIIKKIIFYKNDIYLDNKFNLHNLSLIINKYEYNKLKKNHITINKIINKCYTFFINLSYMYDNKYKNFNDIINFECNNIINNNINYKWLEYDYCKINNKIYIYYNLIKNEIDNYKNINHIIKSLSNHNLYYLLNQ